MKEEDITSAVAALDKGFSNTFTSLSKLETLDAMDSKDNADTSALTAATVGRETLAGVLLRQTPTTTDPASASTPGQASTTSAADAGTGLPAELPVQQPKGPGGLEDIQTARISVFLGSA